MSLVDIIHPIVQDHEEADWYEMNKTGGVSAMMFLTWAHWFDYYWEFKYGGCFLMVVGLYLLS